MCNNSPSHFFRRHTYIKKIQACRGSSRRLHREFLLYSWLFFLVFCFLIFIFTSLNTSPGIIYIKRGLSICHIVINVSAFPHRRLVAGETGRTLVWSNRYEKDIFFQINFLQTNIRWCESVYSTFINRQWLCRLLSSTAWCECLSFTFAQNCNLI